MKNFKRMNQNKWLGGVLSGIAYKFNLPTSLVRLAFFITIGSPTLCTFLILIYCLTVMYASQYEVDPDDYKKACA